LIIDTAVTKDKLINMRFCLSYERNIGEFNKRNLTNGGSWSMYADAFSSLDKIQFINNKVEYNWYGLYYYFGLGLIRTENFRLWIGPEIKIGYSYIKSSFNEYGIISVWGYSIGTPQFYNYFMPGLLHKYYVLDFGTGISTGVNFKVNTSFSIAIQGGVRLTVAPELLCRSRDI